MNTIDNKINSLKKGESLVISSCNNITVHAERSTDGKTLRIVRTYLNGSFEVIKSQLFF